MNSQQKSMKSTNIFVQYSKRIATWSLIQWAIIVIIVIGTLIFANLAYEEINVLSSIVTWSATLAGVGITGYMGNSSIEKYVTKKFSFHDSTTETQG